MARNRITGRLAVFAAVALIPLISVAPAAAAGVRAAAAGDGLIATQSGTCNEASGNIDASSATWNWTKPMLEISSDNGSTWTSAATFSFTGGKQFQVQVCRAVAGQSGGAATYWFQVVPKNGANSDLGADVVTAGLRFRITFPTKAGDTALRMTGYSEVVSYTETGGTVTAIVKASKLAKINFQNGFDWWKTAAPSGGGHTECASYTAMTWKQCSIAKADQDLAGAIIEHISYTTSAPTAWQTLAKGVWIGANVNGYSMEITCASQGTDAGSYSNGGNYGSSPDGGANIGGTSTTVPGSSSSTTPPSLSVDMSGTPHLRADGTANEGSMQAFLPETIARKCFGDGTTTISMDTIATNLNIGRTEKNENGGAEQALINGTNYTAVGVTSPVAGLLINVAKMTFSNPTYKISSKLAQQLLATYSAGASAGNSTSGGATTGGATTNTTPTANTSPGAYNTQNGLSTTVTTTASLSAKVSGSKVALTVTMGTAQKIKVYKKVGTKLTLVKTLSAKIGANVVSTAHKKGTTYVVKDSKGKTLTSLKP